MVCRFPTVHYTILGIVFISFIGFLNGGRVKRNVFEFGEMVQLVTGRDPSDFYGYGHYCGVGGEGTIVDPIDMCCKQHDDCYTDQKLHACSYYSPRYSWDMSMFGVQCLDPPGDYCRRHLCECDKAVAECFGANNEFYDAALTRRVHKIAHKLFHFLEPIVSEIIEPLLELRPVL